MPCFLSNSGADNMLYKRGLRVQMTQHWPWMIHFQNVANRGHSGLDPLPLLHHHCVRHLGKGRGTRRLCAPMSLLLGSCTHNFELPRTANLSSQLPDTVGQRKGCNTPPPAALASALAQLGIRLCRGAYVQVRVLSSSAQVSCCVFFLKGRLCMNSACIQMGMVWAGRSCVRRDKKATQSGTHASSIPEWLQTLGLKVAMVWSSKGAVHPCRPSHLGLPLQGTTATLTDLPELPST